MQQLVGEACIRVTQGDRKDAPAPTKPLAPLATDALTPSKVASWCEYRTSTRGSEVMFEMSYTFLNVGCEGG